MPEKVSIVHSPGDDHDFLLKAVNQAMDLLGSPLSRIRPGDRVIIKPNIKAQDVSWREGVVTNPNLIRAIIEAVRQYNPGEIWIAEAIAIGLDVKKAFAFMGYDQIARETDARLVDLYDEEFVRLQVPEGKAHPFRSRRCRAAAGRQVPDRGKVSIPPEGSWAFCPRLSTPGISGRR